VAVAEMKPQKLKHPLKLETSMVKSPIEIEHVFKAEVTGVVTLINYIPFPSRRPV
jgi:hypothetical protein